MVDRLTDCASMNTASAFLLYLSVFSTQVDAFMQCVCVCVSAEKYKSVWMSTRRKQQYALVFVARCKREEQTNEVIVAE